MLPFRTWLAFTPVNCMMCLSYPSVFKYSSKGGDRKHFGAAIKFSWGNTHTVNYSYVNNLRINLQRYLKIGNTKVFYYYYLANLICSKTDSSLQYKNGHNIAYPPSYPTQQCTGLYWKRIYILYKCSQKIHLNL